MMHIKDDYYLDANDSEFVLKRKTKSTDKNGKTVYKTEGYFNSVEGALKSLLRTYQRKYIKERSVDLAQAYKKFDTLIDEFEQLINTTV